jgi:hypothetical protein
MKILLGDFNAKVGRENIFKPTNGNESLHQDSNYNGYFATSKNIIVKSISSYHIIFIYFPCITYRYKYHRFGNGHDVPGPRH